MNDTLLTALQYFGAGAGLIAAAVVAANIGRRPTGWAFVLFCAGSLALVAWGFLKGESEGIAWQNVGLFAVNVFGVYRYLIYKGDPKPA